MKRSLRSPPRAGTTWSSEVLSPSRKRSVSNPAPGSAANVARWTGRSRPRRKLSPSHANVARLSDLQIYLKVRAPFAGMITIRNIDVGALVNTGNTMLFRIAQTNLLSTL